MRILICVKFENVLQLELIQLSQFAVTLMNRPIP